MTYYIPELKIESFKKKVDALIKKGADIKFEIVDKSYRQFDWSNNYFLFYEVDVEGFYKIDNWTVLADLEHTQSGNIIRKVNENYSIPERFKNIKCYCEHCNTLRARKDTFVLFNEETKEYKQVGRTCLKDFLGIDIETIANFSQTLREAELMENDFEFISTGSKYMTNSEVSTASYLVVKTNGYDTDSIKKQVYEKMNDITAEDEIKVNEELKKMDEWIKTLDVENNEYLRNATLAYSLEYVEDRHIKLIASLINSYLKYQQKQKENENKQFVGKIGDRVYIRLTSARILYYNSNKQYSYYASESYKYRLTDINGNIYIWTTCSKLEGNEAIRATIKEFNEYNGEKQTVITRGTIL